MVYSIVSWNQFHEDLLEVSQKIAKKANLEMDYLNKYPRSKKGIEKIQGFNYLFRKKVARSHRIILFIKQRQIKFLRLIPRDKKTYNINFLKWLEREACKEKDRNISSGEQKRKETKSLLTREKLAELKIPQQYWKEILRFDSNNQDYLDSADLPKEYIGIVLEYLFPQENKKNKSTLAVEQFKHPVEHAIDYDRTNNLIEKKISINQYRQSSLILDNNQKKYASLGLKNRHFRQAILIKGTAGTGKSLIAFHRIQNLLEAGHKRVLYVTYNEALANYALSTVTALLKKSPQELGVDILTVDRIINYYYLQKYSPPNIADRYNQLNCLKQAISTVKIDSKLKQKLLQLGNKYLLDEFLTIIESQEITSLDLYRVLNRKQRKTRFSKKERQGIWKIYQRWKKIIKEELNYELQEWINLKALELIRKQDIKIEYYDSIIIDEAQDLSPVALNLLILLVNSTSNVFLTADNCQSLYQKGFCWQSLPKHLNFNYTTKIIKNSYRSSQSIYKACQEILEQSQIHDRSIDINEFSQKSCNKLGEKPTLLLTDKIENITNKIIEFFQKSAEKYNIPLHEGAIISNDYPDNFQDIVIRGLQKKELPVELFNSNSLDNNNNCIKALNMYDAKGLEFPFVVIVGLSRGVLPKEESTNLNPEERSEIINQQCRLFYVACTRATKSLLVIGSLTNRSEFLSLVNNNYWNKIKMQ